MKVLRQLVAAFTGNHPTTWPMVGAELSWRERRRRRLSSAHEWQMMVELAGCRAVERSMTRTLQISTSMPMSYVRERDALVGKIAQLELKLWLVPGQLLPNERQTPPSPGTTTT